MVCSIARISEEEIHRRNSISGFDIHYKEFDELHAISYFCDKKFESEDTAWFYASTFANDNFGRYVDIYVVYSLNNLPVLGYTFRSISNFPRLI